MRNLTNLGRLGPFFDSSRLIIDKKPGTRSPYFVSHTTYFVCSQAGGRGSPNPVSGTTERHRSAVIRTLVFSLSEMPLPFILILP
jgi:hypothetical protein